MWQQLRTTASGRETGELPELLGVRDAVTAALSKVTGLLLFALGESRLGPCYTEIRGQNNTQLT